MHLHLPKPLHGWRAFFNEIVVIVLGVLIALAAEQSVESMHWRHAVGDGREALHREMAFDAAYLRDRLTIAPCIDRRIATASARIDAATAGKALPPSAMLVVGPGRLTLTAEWDAEEASQTLTHFPRAELSRLGAWYDQIRGMRSWVEQEMDAWAKLAILSSPRGLGPMDIALLRQELQRARSLEYLMVLNARRELDLAAQLGVTPDPPRRDYIEANCRAA